MHMHISCNAYVYVDNFFLYGIAGASPSTSYLHSDDALLALGQLLGVDSCHERFPANQCETITTGKSMSIFVFVSIYMLSCVWRVIHIRCCRTSFGMFEYLS